MNSDQYTQSFSHRNVAFVEPISRYIGLQSGEKWISRTATAVTCGLLACVTLLFRHDPVEFPPQEPASLQMFDLAPPPLPKQIPEKQPRAPVKAAEAETKRGRVGSVSDKKSLPPPTPIILSTIVAPGPAIVLKPIPVSGQTAFQAASEDGLEGGSGAGAGNGADLGTGNGNGNGNGNGSGDGTNAEVRYAQASWIKQPTRAELRRSWPPGVRRLEVPVTVLLACRVKPSGRPYDCNVLKDSVPGRGFGKAGVGLIKQGRLRPVLRNGSPVDLPVLIPLTFMPYG